LRWPIHNPDKLVMKSLRSLLFRNQGIYAASVFLSISAPRLESLWWDFGLDRLHLDHIPEFLRLTQTIDRGIFPNLRYLTLQDHDLSNTTFFAESFPSVTHLHLAYCNVFHTSHLHTLLESYPLLWLHLEAVAIRTRNDLHVEKLRSALVDITAFRYRCGSPVRRIYVDADVLSTFRRSQSLQATTELVELMATSYADPLWVVTHEDSGDQI